MPTIFIEWGKAGGAISRMLLVSDVFWTVSKKAIVFEGDTLQRKLMEKRAHGVLRGKIGRIKESNVDPAWLAGKLLAAGIIGDSDVEKASNDRELSTKRLSELVRTVMRNGAPGVFQTFVQILLRKTEVNWLGKELKGNVPYT